VREREAHRTKRSGEKRGRFEIERNRRSGIIDNRAFRAVDHSHGITDRDAYLQQLLRMMVDAVSETDELRYILDRDDAAVAKGLRRDKKQYQRIAALYDLAWERTTRLLQWIKIETGLKIDVDIHFPDEIDAQCILNFIRDRRGNVTKEPVNWEGGV